MATPRSARAPQSATTRGGQEKWWQSGTPHALGDAAKWRGPRSRAGLPVGLGGVLGAIQRLLHPPPNRPRTALISMASGPARAHRGTQTAPAGPRPGRDSRQEARHIQVRLVRVAQGQVGVGFGPRLGAPPNEAGAGDCGVQGRHNAPPGWPPCWRPAAGWRARPDPGACAGSPGPAGCPPRCGACRWGPATGRERRASRHPPWPARRGTACQWQRRRCRGSRRCGPSGRRRLCCGPARASPAAPVASQPPPDAPAGR
mgnify:CR=1 FL=1